MVEDSLGQTEKVTSTVVDPQKIVEKLINMWKNLFLKSSSTLKTNKNTFGSGTFCSRWHNEK